MMMVVSNEWVAIGFLVALGVCVSLMMIEVLAAFFSWLSGK